MAEMQIQEWLPLLSAFVRRLQANPVGGDCEATLEIRAALSRSELQQITAELRLPPPLGMVNWLLNVCSGLKLHYRLSVGEDYTHLLPGSLAHANCLCGGCDLCEAEAFAQLQASTLGWAQDSWISDYPDESRVWHEAFPVAVLPRGDFLALGGGDSAEAPLLYLDHENGHHQVAASFEEFLGEWASVYYLAPEVLYQESDVFHYPRSGESLNERLQIAKSVRGILSGLGLTDLAGPKR